MRLKKVCQEYAKWLKCKCAVVNYFYFNTDNNNIKLHYNS